jgi:hypothetical protein
VINLLSWLMTPMLQKQLVLLLKNEQDEDPQGGYS